MECSRCFVYSVALIWLLAVDLEERPPYCVIYWSLMEFHECEKSRVMSAILHVSLMAGQQVLPDKLLLLVANSSIPLRLIVCNAKVQWSSRTFLIHPPEHAISSPSILAKGPVDNNGCNFGEPSHSFICTWHSIETYFPIVLLHLFDQDELLWSLENPVQDRQKRTTYILYAVRVLYAQQVSAF